MSVSCQFTAEGAVLFPDSGLFTPNAAQRRSERASMGKVSGRKDRLGLPGRQGPHEGYASFLVRRGKLDGGQLLAGSDGGAEEASQQKEMGPAEMCAHPSLPFGEGGSDPSSTKNPTASWKVGNRWKSPLIGGTRSYSHIG